MIIGCLCAEEEGKNKDDGEEKDEDWMERCEDCAYKL